MAKLTVEVDSGNAALAGDPVGESTRILRRIAERIEEGAKYGRAFDVNGNVVGRWTLTE